MQSIELVLEPLREDGRILSTGIRGCITWTDISDTPEDMRSIITQRITALEGIYSCLWCGPNTRWSDHLILMRQRFSWEDVGKTICGIVSVLLGKEVVFVLKDEMDSPSSP